MTTITSANSVFTVVVPGLFPSPQQLQGYSSDAAFTTQTLVLAEAQMGVDGRMTAGYTPTPTVQTIMLQADSPSRDVFSGITQATKTAREIYWMDGTITLPATGEVYTLIRGTITSIKQIPDAQKVLQPVEIIITWQAVNRSII